MLALLLVLLASSTHVSFEPLAVTREGIILPGDSIKVTIYHEGEEAPYAVYFLKGEETGVISRGTVKPGSPAELVVNVPWARALAVEVGGRRWELEIAPESKISVVRRGTKFLDVREGSWVKLMALLRTNVPGERAIVRVVDESAGKVLWEEEVRLWDNQLYEFYVKIGENPRFLVFKEIVVLRPLRVELLAEDSFEANNVDYLYVTSRADDIWRVPWGLAVAAGGAAIIALLAAIARRVFA
ncbi:MAG: hypothetical protein N3F67_04880 [Acidilobaceae archaeon]|nr:hypothetical protein [Acidilobaceae archaeon]